jgi:hypothetical protein
MNVWTSCELVGQTVSIGLYPEPIDVVAHDSVAASRLHCFERNKTRYDWQHYIPLIEPKPGAFRDDARFAGITQERKRIADFTWRDLRHEAVSRPAERGDVNLIEMAAASGHKTLQMLKRYTHLQARTLAKKLSRPPSRAQRPR